MGYENKKKHELRASIDEISEAVGRQSKTSLPVSSHYQKLVGDDKMPIGYNEPGVYSTLEVDMREEEDEDKNKFRFGSELGERYEDQVVPAKRRIVDLDAEIKKYEQE